MTKQTAIQLPDETYDRLHALAEKTGRPATFYIRQAIEEHLDDLEDLYLAERAVERLQRGGSRVVSAEEFWDGLAD